ncbi:discoidin domain-containing protein [Actinoplanes sp. CA-054009]
MTTTAPAPVVGKGNPSRANLALTGTATASSVEGGAWSARMAIDGDPGTRWSSGFSDAQWFLVDLREARQLSEITLVWEQAYGASYNVGTSLDGRTWRTLWSTTSGHGGTVTVGAGGTVARYVRMVGVRRASSYGYSLLELEIR